MSGPKRSEQEVMPEVAEHMVDAVTYLSRIAGNAGLMRVSADLLAIKRRLAREAERARSETADKVIPRAARKTKLGTK